MKKPLVVLILAAGKGSRMKGDVPKVLIRIGGKPMVHWVIEKALALNPAKIVVVESVARAVSSLGIDAPLHYAVQAEPKGVADAVASAEAHIDSTADVLLLLGDSPLADSESIRRMVAHHQASAAAVTILTTKTTEPFRFSEVVRDDASMVQALVVQQPKSPRMRELSVGPLMYNAAALYEVLPRLVHEGEARLEDSVAALARAGHKAVTYNTDVNTPGVWGINTPEELAGAKLLLTNVS